MVPPPGQAFLVVRIDGWSRSERLDREEGAQRQTVRRKQPLDARGLAPLPDLFTVNMQAFIFTRGNFQERQLLK